MRQDTVWIVILAAFSTTVQISMDVAGSYVPMPYTSRIPSPSSSMDHHAGAKGSPRFVDYVRMKQTFIAWPARHSVRLKCKANGSKPLRFQWLKDGHPSIERRLQPRLKTHMWYLKIKDLVPLDSGAYTCVVSNVYGSINHTYTLRVVEKSRTKPILKCGYPKNTSVLLGQNTSMTCIVVISGTLPDFRWLKWKAIPKNYPDSLDFESGSYNLVNPVQYETVPVDGKYGVKVNIQNVTAKDLGMYTCYVSNHLGFNYRNAFLSEREKVSKGTKDEPSNTTPDPEKRYHANQENWETSVTKDTKLSPSPNAVLSRSREPQIPLSVFITVLSTWAVITTLALFLCHLYHKKIISSKLGVQ